MARTNDDGRLRIFISHKEVEHNLARKTKEVLESLSPKISCFVSGVDVPAGADWNRLIKSALAESRLLLLLFANPDHKWDWCLYEAGLFTRFEADKPKAVVTIYNPKAAPPGPLENLQGVPADPRKVVTFLKRLCKTTHEVSDDWSAPPLNVDVSQKKLNAAAKTICENFRHALTHHPCHRVILDLSGLKEVGETIPEDARVMGGEAGTSDFTLFLFGLSWGKGELFWGELLDRVGGRGATWHRELNASFAAAMKGNLFIPGNATLRTWDKKNAYKPILYRVQKAQELELPNSKTGTKGGHTGRVVPVQVTIVLERISPPVADDILNLICTSNRYEANVFKPFCDGGWLSEEASSHRPAAISEAIHCIETDANPHKLLDGVGALHDALHEICDHQALDELTNYWREASKLLENALREEQSQRVEELLAEMRIANQKIGILATECYLERLRVAN